MYCVYVCTEKNTTFGSVIHFIFLFRLIQSRELYFSCFFFCKNGVHFLVTVLTHQIYYHVLVLIVLILIVLMMITMLLFCIYICYGSYVVHNNLSER